MIQKAYGIRTLGRYKINPLGMYIGHGPVTTFRYTACRRLHHYAGWSPFSFLVAGERV